MTKQKKKKGRFFLVSMILLGLLCVVFIAADVYLFILAKSVPQQSAAAVTASAEEAETPSVSELPQIISAAQPEVSRQAQTEEQTPEETAPEQTGRVNWQNDWISFTYDETAMWVSESGGVIMVTDPQFADLPRMDVQQVSGAEELTQAEFEILAKAAVRAYYSAEPSADALSLSAVTQDENGWTAELTVLETEASPAMNAWVRLTNDVLISMLLPQTADEETQTIWSETLESVAG